MAIVRVVVSDSRLPRNIPVIASAALKILKIAVTYTVSPFASLTQKDV